MESFPLNIKKVFNLIPNPDSNYGDTIGRSRNNLQYAQAHKGAQIWIPDTTVNRLAVEYEKSVGMTSSGLRVGLDLDPDGHYQVRIKAYLIKGDRAFIYCEDDANERLIPRTHWITQETRHQTFVLEFTANTSKAWLGILFYSSDTSYSLFVEDFTILEIPERSANAPQGPVLTHLIPSSLKDKVLSQPLPPLLESDSVSGAYQVDNKTNINPLLRDTRPLLRDTRSLLRDTRSLLTGATRSAAPVPQLQLQNAPPLIITLALSSEAAITRNRSKLETLKDLGKIRIILHIPYEVDEVPNWLIHLPNLELNRCPNYGCFTSLLGLLPLLPQSGTTSWLLASLQSEDLPSLTPTIVQNVNDGQREWLSEYQQGKIAYWEEDVALLPSSIFSDNIYEVTREKSLTGHRSGSDLLAAYLIAEGYTPPRQDREQVKKIQDTLVRKKIWQSVTSKKDTELDRDVPIPPPPEKAGKIRSRKPYRAKVPARVNRIKINRNAVRARSKRIRINTRGNRAHRGKGPKKRASSEKNKEDYDKTESTSDSEMSKPQGVVHHIGPNTIHTIGGSNQVTTKGSGSTLPFERLPFERQGTPVPDSDKVAVIVEPRADPHLILILGHFLSRLDRSWKVQLFHGTRNKTMINESARLHSFIESGELILTNLEVENLTRRQYSQMLLGEDFYNKCKGSLILIFQMDTYLCDNPSRKLSDYYQFDYVGAPWGKKYQQRSLLNKGGGRRLVVGNGGLSLRRKQRMLQVCEILKQRQFRHLLNENEDLVISSILQSSLMKKSPVKLPSAQEAALFSSETIYTRGAIGGHRPWSYHGKNVTESLSKECSVFKALFAGHYFNK